MAPVDDHISLSSVGSRFHAWSAATENARSPIRRSVRDRYCWRRIVPSALEFWLPVWANRWCSRVYLPMRALCTRRHSLYSIRCATGNQCNSRSAGVTWSRGFRWSTSLAAACRTLCSGASVDAGRPARTALQ